LDPDLEEGFFAQTWLAPHLGRRGDPPSRVHWNDASRAQEAYNIFKWGNPADVQRTYELTQDTLMYYGRVAGGEGYQALIPSGTSTGLSSDGWERDS
jgi:hypothetical protein